MRSSAVDVGAEVLETQRHDLHLSCTASGVPNSLFNLIVFHSFTSMFTFNKTVFYLKNYELNYLNESSF